MYCVLNTGVNRNDKEKVARLYSLQLRTQLTFTIYFQPIWAPLFLTSSGCLPRHPTCLPYIIYKYLFMKFSIDTCTEISFIKIIEINIFR